MKLKVILSTILICAAFAVQAQDMKKAEKTAKAKTEKMTKVLQLDDSQKSLVYRQNSVFESYEVRYEAIEDKTEKISKNMEYQRSQYIKNMKDILSDDQFEKFSEMLEEETKSANKRAN